MNNRKTKGVELLLGDPKKALYKLSIPIIISNTVQSLHSIINAFWVSGLGSNALAGIGLFFPFFFISLGIGMGLGIGGGSAISRKIGANDKDGASIVATHTIILTVIISLIYSIPLFVFRKPIFKYIGAGEALQMTLAYSEIMIAGTILVLFFNTASSILRSEGDAKRTMWAMILGSFINLLLDPILIYTLKMGIAGAALATIISMGVTSLLIFNWMFLKKDTYIHIKFDKFRFDKDILIEIFSVGFPATIQFISMSLSMFLMNIIIVKFGGADGVAIYSTGWRIIMFGTIPVFGIASAIIPLSGSAFGGKDFIKLNKVYIYAIKSSAVIELIAGVIVFAFAPQITKIFTYSKNTTHIASEMITFLRITALSYPSVALGPVSGSLFQGVGKGMNSLWITILRTLILVVPFAYLFGNVWGLVGIWWAFVIANIIGAFISFVWAKSYTNKLVAITSL